MCVAFGFEVWGLGCLDLGSRVKVVDNFLFQQGSHVVTGSFGV